MTSSHLLRGIGIIVEGGHLMTITVPIQPHEEACLVALALAKGISADALVREALDRILAEASAGARPQGPATGAALVAAMQASPNKEIGIEAVGSRLPVRNVEF
jgi:hypothetical protein